LAHRRGKIEQLSGIWRSHGYGTLLEIGSAGYRLFEETAVSCLPVFAGSLAELTEYYVDVQVSRGLQAFSARRATGVTRVRYRRLSRLPIAASAPEVAHSGDPVHNFEVFWHTFAERYAMFELRDLDWEAAHARYRPRVDARTGAKRLFETFVEMLRPLRDGHVDLYTSCGHFNAGVVGNAPHEHNASAQTRLRERYLPSGTRRACRGLLEWGRLDSETGYLALHAMAGQSGAANRPREDQAAVAAAMSRVLDDLGDLPAMVVDVRDNGGGYDGVALRIAGYLTDRKRLAFTKAAGKRAGFGPKQSVFIEPRGGHRYTGRIFLLTSRQTTSAAEIFVLALLQQPRVTRVGEATHGELSDVMERHLPNGWSMTLSNELYRAADGELYETCGVPPHVEIPYLDPADVAAGRDPMLDFALGASHGST